MRFFIHPERPTGVKLLSLSRDKSAREGFPVPATKDGDRQVASLIVCFSASIAFNPVIASFGTLA
jgi:hypothetical protein